MKLSIQPLLPIGNYLNKRYGIEMDFPDDSHPADNFKYLNDVVMAIHMAECPFYYKDGKPLYLPQTATTATYNGEEMPKEIQVKEPEPKLSKEERQKKCLTDTTTVDGVDGLKSFALLVKNNPYLQETYNNHLKKLTDGL
jgi:hypothetical protein